jgi:hypothetical protein
LLNAPANYSRLPSANAFSSIGTDRAEGPHFVISLIASIFVNRKEHEGHFVKSEDHFNGVLF